MIEVFLVYGSLVLLNLGVGHSAALLDSQQNMEVQPFDDRPYEVIIEEPRVSQNSDSGDWVAELD
ncbi:MAG: hypothetical protein MI867_01285 [Pseudomonadales bacterium]|nr:hypothetical protein [Pseudomonadales bacterium]